MWVVYGEAHGAYFQETFEDEGAATAYASQVIDGDCDSTVELSYTR
jgi:hypothetical protein